MIAHTPGPWVLHQPGSVRACDGRHDSVDGCRTIVEAEIIGVPRTEAEANACLIAAAPEMLRALTDIAFLVERGWIPPDDEDFDTWNRVADEYRQSTAYAAVRAVIAKAEGRS